MVANYTFAPEMKCIVAIAMAIIYSCSIYAQDPATATKPADVKKHWYENFSIRGYQQTRYNGAYETNKDLKCDQCDRYWGGNGGFGIRRMRVILFGDVSPNVYFYVQPDFANVFSTPTPSGTTGSGSNSLYVQIRDAYVDVAVDKKKEFRFRIGQSKVPYGFENMQSSQNRLPLDRADPLNSAVSNERDLGVFFYYAPKEVRAIFSELVRDNYKGSGDYGVLGIGAYNGQTAGKLEQNKNRHLVARAAYPFKIGNQIIEPSVQAYSGLYKLTADQIRTGTKSVTANNWEFADQRLAGTFVLYPRPFGIFAEWNIGRGPQYNRHTDSVTVQNLIGGYVTATYRYKAKNGMFFFPYARGQYYQGGKKHELNARFHHLRELELGVEWQINKSFELTPSFIVSGRRSEDVKNTPNFQQGQILRIQGQYNF
jgi:hypothetical protein